MTIIEIRNNNEKIFINNANEKHKNKYDYSFVNYKNNTTKVKIICPIHGEFEQTPKSHLKGIGCTFCAGNKNYNNEEFIKKSIEIHGDYYDYSLTKYTKSHSKVKIICPIHGEFEQLAYSHLTGRGCQLCSVENRKLGINDFIKKSEIVHLINYDYTKVNYINNRTKVKIICPIHGEFEQTPDSHLSGRGCPVCSESKGEREISIILEKNNIRYIREKKFNNCINKKELPFDFYLPDYNMCIEFDGIHHFEIVESWNCDNEKLIKTKYTDNIKNKFCKDNNIKLLRIKYDENILEKLNSIMK